MTYTVVVGSIVIVCMGTALGILLEVIAPNLFGCAHVHRSWPRTRWNELHTRRMGEYFVCFDCHREIPYSSRTMQIVAVARRRA